MACESRFLSQALVRDGYKCVVSAKYDFVAIQLGIADDEAIRATCGAVDVPGHLYHVHALFRQGMFLNSTAATVYLFCLEGLFCLNFGIFAIQRSRPF